MGCELRLTDTAPCHLDCRTCPECFDVPAGPLLFGGRGGIRVSLALSRERASVACGAGSGAVPCACIMARALVCGHESGTEGLSHSLFRVLG